MGKPGPCEETVNPNSFRRLAALAIPAYAILSGLIPFPFSHLLTTSVYGTDLAIKLCEIKQYSPAASASCS